MCYRNAGKPQLRSIGSLLLRLCVVVCAVLRGSSWVVLHPGLVRSQGWPLLQPPNAGSLFSAVRRPGMYCFMGVCFPLRPWHQFCRCSCIACFLHVSCFPFSSMIFVCVVHIDASLLHPWVGCAWCCTWWIQVTTQTCMALHQVVRTTHPSFAIAPGAVDSSSPWSVDASTTIGMSLVSIDVVACHRFPPFDPSVTFASAPRQLGFVSHRSHPTVGWEKMETKGDPRAATKRVLECTKRG